MSIYVKEQNGFEIYFSPEEEYDGLEELLPDDTAAQIRGLHKRIENGNAVVFCAKISAHKAGIELGTAYLGGCIYDSYEQFYTAENDYFADLADEAIKEAEAKLRELAL